MRRNLHCQHHHYNQACRDQPAPSTPPCSDRVVRDHQDLAPRRRQPPKPVLIFVETHYGARRTASRTSSQCAGSPVSGREPGRRGRAGWYGILSPFSPQTSSCQSCAGPGGSPPRGFERSGSVSVSISATSMERCSLPGCSTGEMLSTILAAGAPIAIVRRAASNIPSFSVMLFPIGSRGAMGIRSGLGGLLTCRQCLSAMAGVQRCAAPLAARAL